MVLSCAEGLITQLLTAIFLKPPVDSVPNFNALQWLLITQLVMVMFSEICGEVLLMVIPSSSESPVTLEICTFRQPSISIISLFLLEWFQMRMPSIHTNSQPR